MPGRSLSDRESFSRRTHPLVLIIEDSLDQLDLYAMVLEDHVDVLKASRGETGYALACAERPDVIVLDILLPDINGFEVFRRLRSSAIAAAIPVIFLTADEPSVFRAMASRECATAFAILRKPAPADRLLETIRAAVRESQT
jgi:DNA-binding response OmpR family regulator